MLYPQVPRWHFYEGRPVNNMNFYREDTAFDAYVCKWLERYIYMYIYNFYITVTKSLACNKSTQVFSIPLRYNLQIDSFFILLFIFLK